MFPLLSFHSLPPALRRRWKRKPLSLLHSLAQPFQKLLMELLRARPTPRPPPSSHGWFYFALKTGRVLMPLIVPPEDTGWEAGGGRRGKTPCFPIPLTSSSHNLCLLGNRTWNTQHALTLWFSKCVPWASSQQHHRGT